MKTAAGMLMAIALVACGKSDKKSGTSQGSGTPPGVTAPAAAPGTPTATPAPAEVVTGPQNRCDLKVTGDLQLDLHWAHAREGHPIGKLMAATDYWMTEGELKQALEMLSGSFGGKLSEDEKAKKVDEDMKKDPRLMLLMINCGGDEASIILGPGKSKYADVPYQPGKYPISDNGNAVGQFGGMVSFRPDGKRESYRISDQPGELDITKFDATGITGTFHFKAKRVFGEPARNIEVTGSFDYACAGGTICQK